MFKNTVLSKGMKHSIQKMVTQDDTSLNYGSGNIENLLATPRIIALAIEASAQLIDPELVEGLVSICRKIELDHFKGTCMGATVTVEVEVESVENDTIELYIAAFDEHGQVAAGRHTRKIVNYNKLLEKATLRDMSLDNSIE